MGGCDSSVLGPWDPLLMPLCARCLFFIWDLYNYESLKQSDLSAPCAALAWSDLWQVISILRVVRHTQAAVRGDERRLIEQGMDTLICWGNWQSGNPRPITGPSGSQSGGEGRFLGLLYLEMMEDYQQGRELSCLGLLQSEATFGL